MRNTGIKWGYSILRRERSTVIYISNQYVITLNSVSVLNIILFWNPPFTYAITGSHLCCTDLLSSTHKASSSPPSEPLFPLWSCCHDNLLAPQSYLEQGEGTSAALCQWHALTTVRDTVRGRRRSEEVYSVHQNLPSNPGGERNQVFPFQNTHTWHLSQVSTEHWTPCCPVSSPDQNTGKIVAYFTAGNNKMLFIHKGTKNLLETSFTAEKTLTSSQASFKNNSLQQRYWLPYICHVVSNWMSWMGPVYMGLRRPIMFHVILKDKLHFLVIITHQWKGKGYQAL